MPLLQPSDLPALVTPIRDGRLRLVLWGVSDSVALAEWQMGLPIAAYVDSLRAGRMYRDKVIQSPDTLADMDPATTVIAFTYYFVRTFPEYAAVMDRLGLRYFVPAPLEVPPEDRDARLSELFRQAGASPGLRQGIALSLGYLETGGAERQITVLAAGLAARGIKANLITLHPPSLVASNYIHYLLDAGGGFFHDDDADDPERHAEEVLAAGPVVAEALRLVPPHIAWNAFKYYRYFNELRPSAVIAYLDQPNIQAGLGAVLAGVPRVLLSARNLNPTHSPHLFAPRQCEDLRALYRDLLRCPGVILSANSEDRAASYADWLGMPRDEIPVIPNALAPWAAQATIRPLPDGPPRILGVFCGAGEQQLDDFIGVIVRLAEIHPHLRARICDDSGDLGGRRAKLTALGLETRIDVVGVVADMAAEMAKAHLLLHTAEGDGIPNALLEAQALGLPVVAVRSPGALAALAPQWHPFTAEVGDVAGLATSAARILAFPAEAEALGNGAAQHVRQSFSFDRLMEATLAALGVAQP